MFNFIKSMQMQYNNLNDQDNAINHKCICISFKSNQISNATFASNLPNAFLKEILREVTMYKFWDFI